MPNCNWKINFYFFFLVTLAIYISGCSSKETEPRFDRMTPFEDVEVEKEFEEVPISEVFSGDDLPKEDLINAIEQSLIYFKRVSPDRNYDYGDYEYSAEEIINSLSLFKETLKSSITIQELKENLDESFIFLKSPGNNDGRVLFTGYYEPIIEGSLEKKKRYSVPMYDKPEDLKILDLGDFRDSLKNRTVIYRIEDNEVKPYFSRKEIMKEGALREKKLELAWLKSPVDLFFMQVQGSGIVKLENGEYVRFGYNGSNGRTYSSIGKYLIRNKKVRREEMSMQRIRSYLDENPKDLENVLFYNKSYTFFRRMESDEGPYGNINVALTPERSVATDTRKFPKGALAYMKGTIPDFDEEFNYIGPKETNRFVLNQDTGGAIKGYGRVDLFWGNTILARESAGKMANFGDIYLVIAKKEALARMEDK